MITPREDGHVHLADYLPPAWRIPRAELAFDLDAEATTVEAVLSLEPDPFREPQPIELDGEELELLAIELDGRAIGVVGELHPRWRQAYELPGAPVLFELDTEALLERALPAYAGLPRQQPAWRDIAVIADERVTHAALMEAIDAAPTDLVRSARLFDLYRPAAATAGRDRGRCTRAGGPPGDRPGARGSPRVPTRTACC